MDMNTNRICRLCLNHCSDAFTLLDNIVESNLNSIFLNLNLTVTDEPIICESCEGMIKHSLNCKAQWEKNRSSIMDIESYRYEAKIKLESGLNDTNSCRLCLNAVEIDSCVSLKNTDIEMLLKYFPELDFDAVCQPTMCMLCYRSLCHNFNFITSCLQTEEIITEYCDIEGINNKGQIDLNDLVSFKSKNVIRNSDLSNMVETEPSSLDNTLNLEPGFEPKTENVIDIKQEEDFKTHYEVETKMESVENNSSQNMGRMKICDICSYTTTGKYYFDQHMLSHKSLSEVVTYGCEQCTFKTKYKSCLRVHMMVHKSADELVMYKCDLCVYQSKRKSNLNNHMKTHYSGPDVKTYKCPECAFKTKYKRSFETHLANHKSNSEKRIFKCKECAFETDLKKNLQKHVLIHEDPSKVTMQKCTQCTFETKYMRNLRRHMLIHKSASEVVIFSCIICDFRSKHSSSLWNHMATHNGESKRAIRKCPDCDFQTKHNSSFWNHMVRHNPSMCRCPECGYKAQHRYNLQRHMRIHKGVTEVPKYVCYICAFETRRKFNLIRHLLKHSRNGETRDQA